MNAVSEVNEVNRIKELEAALAHEKQQSDYWFVQLTELETEQGTKEHIVNTLNNTNPEHAAYVYLSEQNRRRTRYLIGAALAAKESARLLISAVAGKEI